MVKKHQSPTAAASRPAYHEKEMPLPVSKVAI